MSKKWKYPAGIVVVLLLSFYFYRKYRVAPAIDLKSLPLYELNGDLAGADYFKSKKAVLCFSASWCGSCIKELNEIKKVKNTYLNDVDVIVISDETVDKIESFRERRQLPFKFLRLGKSFSDIGINSIPTTYLLNADGKIKKETVGYINWTDPSTAKHLQTLLESR